MANVTITTTSPQYQQRLAAWNDISSALIPRLRRFYSMSPQRQEQWRTLDPLIDSVLTWAENVQGLAGGDDE